MQYALGHYLRLKQDNGNVRAYQNFFVQSQIDYQGYAHGFLPFGFSGISVNRQGDNVDAALTFPNNDLSRSWASQAALENWLAFVEVVLINPDNPNASNILHAYAGAVNSGAWDDSAVNLTLNSVLDAVNGNVPNRTLHQGIVGRLPASSYVRF
jgi:hypothetical protein